MPARRSPSLVRAPKVTARWMHYRLGGPVVLCLLLGLAEIIVLGCLLVPRYAPAPLLSLRWPFLVMVASLFGGLGWCMAAARGRWLRRMAVLILMCGVLAAGVFAAHAFVWHLMADSIRAHETSAYLAIISDPASVGPLRFAEEEDLLHRMVARQGGFQTVVRFAWWGAMFAVALPWVTACFTAAASRIVVSQVSRAQKIRN